MQIVIDIDEYDYKKAKELVSEGVFDYEGTTAHLFKSVVNGTPLPKGHGVLKDADKIKASMFVYMMDKDKSHEAKSVMSVAKSMVDLEKPIIEADEGE